MKSASTGHDTPSRESIWGRPGTPTAPRLEVSTSADVAVIGGGFAGLSSARYLHDADPSLDIVLLERKHAGAGASGLNAGILSPFLPVSWLIDSTASLRRLEEIRFAARFVAAEIRELVQLIRREQIDCDLHPATILTTGTNGWYQRQVAEIARRCLEAGLPGYVATASELNRHIPYPAHGGYALEGYTLQPFSLVQGLRQYALERGTRIFENTSVTHLRPASRGVEVITAAGAAVKAGKVVVATNAYTRRLGLDHGRRIPKPVRTWLLATVPLDPEVIDRLGFEDQAIGDIGREYFYARLFRNRLLFGGFDRPADDDGGEGDADTRLNPGLRIEMGRRFPFLRGVDIEAMWSGLYHETRTAVPVIRALPDMTDVILNIGYGGVGVTLTQFSGRLVAGLVLGGRHRDPDADRLRTLYQTTRLPVREGLKMGFRLLGSYLGGK